MVTLDFRVINHIDIDDTSCYITVCLAFAFILPKAKYAWLNSFWELDRDGAVSYLTKNLANQFFFHIKLLFLSKDDHKSVFHWPIVVPKQILH